MSLFQKILLGIFGLIIIISIGGYIYFDHTIKSPSKGTNENTIFEVKQGDSTTAIAKKLKTKGLISSDLLFLVVVKLKERPLQKGIYQIPKGSSLVDIYGILTSGKITYKKVTIPEGYRVEQVAQVLDKAGLVSYDKFVQVASPYEGTLFPDTYYFPLNVSVDEIVADMRSDYQNRTKDLTVTQEDLVIASIVEREAINDAERPLIAGIYKNRLKIGMKLEADPTVYFGNDTIMLENMATIDKTNYKFWKPIALKDYRSVDSPFNTYLYAALPPGPICNPGVASIRATINYTSSDYLFFLQRDGKIYPAKTEAEHNANRVKVLGVRTGL